MEFRFILNNDDVTLKEKFEVLMALHGYNLKTIAVRLDLTYKVLSKNIVEDKLTSEMMKALKREFPDTDLNWWFAEEPTMPMIVAEPEVDYSNPRATIKKIKDLLSGLENSLTDE